MDKYAVYVIVVYVVTLLLLGAYLVWLAQRLRATRNEAGLTEQVRATSTPGNQTSSRQTPGKRG
ncbi:hypothetical protein [Deinococcus aquatilis]|uniref:hypothetical protein n=1 Tax=Deinococcus aquatilis TaxID=519440 RepID=UPI00037DF12C|nr:hypothetical protein [Deinococcus aquatilis]